VIDLRITHERFGSSPDEYANILKDMYSTRFNVYPENKHDYDQMDTAPGGPSPPLITSLQTCQPNKNFRVFNWPVRLFVG
jgi:hypothetical protein